MTSNGTEWRFEKVQDAEHDAIDARRNAQHRDPIAPLGEPSSCALEAFR